MKLDGHDYCAFGAPWATSRKAVLWDDSHAQHLAPLLDAVSRQHGVSFILEDQCPAVLGADIFRRWSDQPAYEETCRAAREAMLRILTGSDDVEIVVIASAWVTLATNDIYSTRPDHARLSKTEMIMSGLDDLLLDIHRPGRAIAAVTNMTGPGIVVTDCAIAAEAGLFRRQCPSTQLSIRSRDKRAMFDLTDNALSAVAMRWDATVLRPTETMCDDEVCLSRVNGEFIWMDYSHLRRNLPPETDLSLARTLQLETLFR